jgi:hypothetical protein
MYCVFVCFGCQYLGFCIECPCLRLLRCSCLCVKSLCSPYSLPSDCHKITVFLFIIMTCHLTLLSPRSAWSKSKSRYDWRSVRVSRCRADSGTSDQILLPALKLLSCLSEAPSMTRGRVFHLPFSVCSNLSACTLRIYVSCVWYLCLVLKFANLHNSDWLGNMRHLLIFYWTT